MSANQSYESVSDAAQSAAESVTVETLKSQLQIVSENLEAAQNVNAELQKRGDDWHRAYKETKETVRKQEQKITELTAKVEISEITIQRMHCDAHVDEGKLHAYENVVSLLVTGKPASERDAKMPPAGLSDLLRKAFTPKTEH